MVQLVCRPYTQVRQTICMSGPEQTSSRVSSGFALLRIVHCTNYKFVLNYISHNLTPWSFWLKVYKDWKIGLGKCSKHTHLHHLDVIGKDFWERMCMCMCMMSFDICPLI